jgi:RNA polymerase subunit RPABC4/transcription elongation factor Spt4
MKKEEKITACRKCNAPMEKGTKICPACGAKQKKPIYKRIWFILLMIILIIGVFNSIRSTIASSKKEKIDWSGVVLKDKLPEPGSDIGTIIINDSDALSMEVKKLSESDYQDYIEACEEMGYTVESEKTGGVFYAFDEEGYELSLNYIDETMYIDLSAPMQLGSFSWPNSDLAALLPVPESTVGKISSDTSDRFYLYVGESPLDDFNSYVDKCAEAGFTVDYDRGEKYYHAEDEQGNKLSIQYLGNSVMSIELERGEEDTKADSEAASDVKEEQSKNKEEKAEDNQKKSETKKKESTSSESSSKDSDLVDGMHPEFKEAMDSYEEFIDEYCEFMKKYADSDGTDLGMLADYTEYMGKYADSVASFDAWDEDEMNDTELAYYLDVQTRVNKKLIEIE